VVGGGARVDDVPNRLVGDLADGGHHGIGLFGNAGVDDHHAVRSRLHPDVAATTDDEVEVRPEPQHFEAVLCQRLRSRSLREDRTPGLGREQPDETPDCCDCHTGRVHACHDSVVIFRVRFG
jgi:hypothetical protein